MESLKVNVKNHSDDVSKLEAELKYTKSLIEQIDNNLEEFEIKIKASENVIEKLNNVADSVKNNSDENEIKQCMYDRKGFCREQTNCKFFHATQICEIYLKRESAGNKTVGCDIQKYVVTINEVIATEVNPVVTFMRVKTIAVNGVDKSQSIDIIASFATITFVLSALLKQHILQTFITRNLNLLVASAFTIRWSKKGVVLQWTELCTFLVFSALGVFFGIELSGGVCWGR